MKLIVFLLIMAVLLAWIIISRIKMNQEEKQLNGWLHEKGLVLHKQDPFNLEAVIQDSGWLMDLSSIAQVMQVRYRQDYYYLFNADHKVSERVYRTYGCILITIPQHRSMLMFPKNREDLIIPELKKLYKKVDHLVDEALRNIFTVYAEEHEEPLTVLHDLVPVVLDAALRELVIEIRDDHALVLSDEYFTVADIEAALDLGQRISELFHNKGAP
jgi:hypothetical protein